MAWGSGTFSRLYNWVADRDAGTKILAQKMDDEMDGFATGINTCLTKDGQNSPTGNLPMATYRHTGVGNAAARTDYAAAGQVQDGGLTYAAVSGTDTYTMTLFPAITAYAAGQVFYGLVTNANTGASTLNVNSAGAKAIVDIEGNALSAGVIAAGTFCQFGYDGTSFVLMSAIPAASTSLAGRVELATVAEAQAGTDTERAVTPDALEGALDSNINPTWVFIESKSFGGGTSIAFTDAAMANYQDYRVEFEFVRDSDTAGTAYALICRLQVGGTPSTASYADDTGSSSTYWNIDGLEQSLTAYHGTSGYIEIIKANAADYSRMHGVASSNDGATVTSTAKTGLHAATTAYDELLFGSNLTTNVALQGTVHVYGRKPS